MTLSRFILCLLLLTPLVAESAPADAPQKEPDQASSSASAPSSASSDMRGPVKFIVTEIRRGITRSQRTLSSPRMVTLQVVSPRRPLDERSWKGKRLSVFRLRPVKSAIALPNQDDDPSLESEYILPPMRVDIGKVKIRSVHGMTLQAVVVNDDLISRSADVTTSEARVVMINDLASEPVPQLKGDKKSRVRRTRKAQKVDPFERKEMRWKM
jgi:hypothetical protein